MGLKVIRTFGAVWEAGMAKSILEAEGIPAWVEDARPIVIGLPTSSSFTGARLSVGEEDLAGAEEVLRRWDESKEPADESTDAEDWDAAPKQPGCDEAEDESEPKA